MTNSAKDPNIAQRLEQEAGAREAALKMLRELPGEDIEVGYGPYGAPYLFRSKEFLCGPAEAQVLAADLRDVAVEANTRRRPEPEDKDRLAAKDANYWSPFGCTRWTVKGNLSAADVVKDLRDRVTYDQLSDELKKERTDLAINLNHVYTAAGIFQFGPGSDPEPTDEPVNVTAFAAPRNGPAALVAVLDTGTLVKAHLSGQHGLHLRSHEIGADSDDVDPVDPNAKRPVSGHGVFVAGQFCRDDQIRIDPESTMSKEGITDEHELLIDIRDVIDRAQAGGDHGPDVVNLSLYGYPADGVQASFKAAFKDAIARSPKTAWVAAAGNDNDTRETWPAALPGVVGVGSVDAKGNRSAFSNHGKWVRACAAGENVVSLFVDGPVRIGGNQVRFNGTAKWSGTSFAVPIVCLAIIRMMRDKGVTAAEAVEMVLQLGDDKSALGLGSLIS
jgi:hypothetical protein